MLKAIEAIYFQWPFCFNCPYKTDPILQRGVEANVLHFGMVGVDGKRGWRDLCQVTYCDFITDGILPPCRRLIKKIIWLYRKPK